MENWLRIAYIFSSKAAADFHGISITVELADKTRTKYESISKPEAEITLYQGRQGSFLVERPQEEQNSEDPS